MRVQVVRWLSSLQTQRKISHQFTRGTDFNLAVLSQKDAPAIIDCLRRCCYPREYLNKGLDFHRDGEWPCMEAFDTMNLDQGLSLGAFSADGKLMAVSLNSAYTVEDDHENRVTWNSIRDDVPPDATNFKTQEEKFGQIVRLLKRVNADSELFVKYPYASKILDMNLIGVEDAWGGKGIGKLITSDARVLGKSKGCQLARAVSTSPISASILRALDYREVHELDLSQILDARGQPVFKPPHHPVVSYVAVL